MTGYVGEVEYQVYGATAVRVSFAVEIYLPSPALRQTKQARTPRARQTVLISPFW